MNPPATTPRLEQLRARPRRPGLAALFWYEPQFGCEAVKVLPGEYFADDQDVVVTTTLGSCIAACLWDRRARVGGMNHFMLPGSAGDDGDAPGDGGRYGAQAMQALIDALLALGASRAALEAKLFGGGQVIAGMQRLEVGERNARFALDYLAAERIPVVARDLLGVHPRKVCFLPASGKAMVKRLAPTHGRAVLAEERAAARRAVAGGGPVERC